MIEHSRTAFPVDLMCRRLKVSSSSYYYDWRTAELSQQQHYKSRLLRWIKTIHTDSDAVYACEQTMGYTKVIEATKPCHQLFGS